MDAALLVSRLVSEGLAEGLEPAERCVASARLGDLEVSATASFPAGALRRRLAALWKAQVGSTARNILLVADDRGPGASAPRSPCRRRGSSTGPGLGPDAGRRSRVERRASSSPAAPGRTTATPKFQNEEAKEPL